MNDFESIKHWLLNTLKANDKAKLTQYNAWHDIDVRWVSASNSLNENLCRDVVWHLCNIGILRPGCYADAGYSGGEPSNYFCMTNHGKKWLGNVNLDNYVSIPNVPSEFFRLFDTNVNKFGNAFEQRVAEAVNCYNLQLFTACHVMVGSAIESILLAILGNMEKISEKTKNEILQDYKRGSTKRLEENTINKLSSELRESYNGLCAFIKDFRNNAAHGDASVASESSAYLALVSLYRFANLVCKKVFV